MLLIRILIIVLIWLQALLGTTIQVPTLDNKRVTLQLNDVVKPTTVRRIQGEGLPLPKQPSRRGDLIVEFDIKFPDKLSPRVKQLVSENFPHS